MKRAFQIVIAFLAVLLVAQPALAGMNCQMSMAPGVPCAPACGMDMGQMGADCPMHSDASAGVCLQDCCRTSSLQAVLQPVSKFRLRAFASPVLLPLAQVAAPSRTLIAYRPANLRASPPHRYILFQVFRI